MKARTTIAQRPFRQWYERELLSGHAHLVLLVLAAVGALGAVEAFSRAGSERWQMAASLLVCAGIGAFALRRYLFHLLRAERVANQANCPACGAYGRFDLDTRFAAASLPGDDPAAEVSCRGCRHRWRIDA